MSYNKSKTINNYVIYKSLALESIPKFLEG